MLLVVEGWWLKIHAALRESFTLRGPRDCVHAQVCACCGEGKIVGTNPSEIFDSNWIMFALHCANAIIIIIIIAIVIIVIIILISKRFKNKLKYLTDWRFMSIIL